MRNCSWKVSALRTLAGWRREAYRQSPLRRAAFAGRGYEADSAKLKKQIDGFFTSKEGPDFKPSEHAGKKIKGLVAPTYDLKQAGPIYAWAYKELQDAEQPDLFVIIGTASAGLDHVFAVTDKDFETPLGVVSADQPILSQLKAKLPTSLKRIFAIKRSRPWSFNSRFFRTSWGARSLSPSCRS